MSLSSYLRKPIVRFSAMLFAALTVVGGLQALLAAYVLEELHATSEQQAQYRIAGAIARQLQDDLHPSIHPVNVQHKLRDIMQLHPGVRVYFLSKHGVILDDISAFPSGTIPYVDLKPLKRLLRSSSLDTPVYGVDPAEPSKKKPFSVAPVLIEYEPGYLYAIVDGWPSGNVVSQFWGIRTGRMVFFLLALSAFTSLLITLALLFFLSQRYRALSDILTHISHDLRSPLGTVTNYLETLLLRDGTLAPDQRKKFIETALRRTNSVCQLLQDLLAVTDLRNLQDAVEMTPIPAVEVTSTAVEKYIEEAGKKHVKLKLKYDPTAPFVNGDRVKIERVIGNLVENAIRYTPEGGNVTVSVLRIGPKVFFRVADTGIGIAPSERRKIFKQFYRSERAREHEPKGCGLGLALVKQLVEAHGATLNCSSEPGRGTVFEFSLPFIEGAAVYPVPNEIVEPVAA